jgi:hypothetical protein
MSQSHNLLCVPSSQLPPALLLAMTPFHNSVFAGPSHNLLFASPSQSPPSPSPPCCNGPPTSTPQPHQHVPRPPCFLTCHTTWGSAACDCLLWREHAGGLTLACAHSVHAGKVGGGLHPCRTCSTRHVHHRHLK